MLHRFHLPAPLTIGERVSLRDEELHHAARVVRVRERESVELFDGNGNAARGVVEELGREAIVIRIEEAVPSREMQADIHLAMAIINLDKFELVLQKATELGVRSLIPLETERCEVRVERYRGKHERWEKIIFEAVKQSGRSRIPKLEMPQPFAEVIAREGSRLFFDADHPPAGETGNPVTLFIGPEGGWSDGEIGLARAHGASFRQLGIRRLRAETAAIVATGIVAAHQGEI
ncbi:MAG TPA: RsmE family RNA methyltransferase [Thermoanaerobaculia bacterium]|jgi:16S rRNA (uracil1498-N3)-methyltransferase